MTISRCYRKDVLSAVSQYWWLALTTLLVSVAFPPQVSGQIPSLQQGRATWMANSYTNDRAIETLRSHAAGYISGCSGAWIGPTLFMTANHCAISPGDDVKMELYPRGSRVEGQDQDLTYTCTRYVARAYIASGSDLAIWQCGTEADVAPGDRHGWLDYSILANDRKGDEVYSIWGNAVQRPPNNWGWLKLYSDGKITATDAKVWAAPNCVNHRETGALPHVHRTNLYMAKGGSGSPQLSNHTHTIVIGPTSTGPDPGRGKNASSMRQILNVGDLPSGETYRIETTDPSQPPASDPLTGLFSNSQITGARMDNGRLTLEVENIHFFKAGMKVDVRDPAAGRILTGDASASNPEGKGLEVLNVDAAADEIRLSGDLESKWVTVNTDRVDLSVPTTSGGCAVDESHLYGLQETDSDGNHVIDIHEELEDEITNRDIYTLDFNSGWRRALWQTGSGFQAWERLSTDQPWQFYALAQGGASQSSSENVLEHSRLNLKPNTTYFLRVAYRPNGKASLPKLQVAFDGSGCEDAQTNELLPPSQLARSRSYHVSSFHLDTGSCEDPALRINTVGQGSVYVRSVVLTEEKATWAFDTWDQREPWRQGTTDENQALVYEVKPPRGGGHFSGVVEDHGSLDLPMLPLQPCTSYRLQFSAMSLQGSFEPWVVVDSKTESDDHWRVAAPPEFKQPGAGLWDQYVYQFDTGTLDDAELSFTLAPGDGTSRMAVDNVEVVPRTKASPEEQLVNGECVAVTALPDAAKQWFGTYTGRNDGRRARLSIEPNAANTALEITFEDLERGTELSARVAGSHWEDQPVHIIRDLTLTGAAGNQKRIGRLFLHNDPRFISGYAVWKEKDFGLAFSEDDMDSGSGSGERFDEANWAQEWTGSYEGRVDGRRVALTIAKTDSELEVEWEGIDREATFSTTIPLDSQEGPSHVLSDLILKSPSGGTKHIERLLMHTWNTNFISGYTEWQGTHYGNYFVRTAK